MLFFYLHEYTAVNYTKMQARDLSLVDEIMIEFGSFTCADVSLESVKIVYIGEDKEPNPHGSDSTHSSDNNSHTNTNSDIPPAAPPTNPTDNVLSYQRVQEAWAYFRRTAEMVEKFGPVEGAVTPPAIYPQLRPVFELFVSRDKDPNQPYYLCICRESGDEYIIRRSLPDDKFTRGKFLILNCEYSKMDDCIPRNKLRQTRIGAGIDGEYLLCIIHIPGSAEDREKLRVMLDQYAREGKFALPF